MIEIVTYGSRKFDIDQYMLELQPLFSDISSHSSLALSERAKKILISYFGIHWNGILAELSQKFYEYSPLEWIHPVEKLLSLVDPSSQFMKILLTNENTRITLPERILPKGFNISLWEERKGIDIRLGYKGYTTPILDAFYFFLLNAIYHEEDVRREVSEVNQLVEDDIFHKICKNPLLRLLEKNLKFFKKDQIILSKMTEIIRLYMMDQILIKYERENEQKFAFKNSIRHENQLSRQRQSQQHLKYRLKESHLLCMYLSIGHAPDYFADIKKYITGICENYSIICGNNRYLYHLVRIWLLSFVSEKSFELKVIDSLENNNSKKGWFALERILISQVENDKIETPMFSNLAESLIDLFDKESNWEANCSYIYVVGLLFRTLNCGKFYPKKISKKTLVSEMNNNSKLEFVMNKIFQRIEKQLVRIVSNFQGNPKHFEQLYEILHSIEEYHSNLLSQVKDKNHAVKKRKPYVFKMVSQQDLIKYKKNKEIISESIEFEEKNDVLSFYRKKQKQPWQIPLQYEESLFLFYFLYGIAKVVDFGIPGKRPYPILNLRLFAAPFYFLILLLLVGFLKWLI